MFFTVLKVRATPHITVALPNVLKPVKVSLVVKTVVQLVNWLRSVVRMAWRATHYSVIVLTSIKVHKKNTNPLGFNLFLV